jgi:hypothetical protein
MKIRTPLALASLALAGFLGGCAANGETAASDEKNGSCCAEGASAGKACCAEGSAAKTGACCEGEKAQQPAAK